MDTVRHRPSVADVAKLARVSVGTVSNVLNRPQRVSPATRERVEAAIAELDFVPSASARQLRAGVAQSVGAIVLDVANPFFTAVARGIEDRIASEGLALLVSSSDDDPAREAHFLRLYEQHGVRGVLVTPSSTDLSELEALRARGTHVVLMDADAGTDFPSVSANDELGARLAVEHLIERGHRRITFINGPTAIRQCAARLAGARSAVSDAGLDPDEVLTELTIGSLNADSGELAAHRLLELPVQQRPTAVFCVNDLVALGALRTVLRAGVRVPEEMAVVGYDDVAFASMLMVPLTTVRQPTHDIGWAAADLLLGLDGAASAESNGAAGLRGSGNGPVTWSVTSARPDHVDFAPELVVRLSSDPDALP